MKKDCSQIRVKVANIGKLVKRFVRMYNGVDNSCIFLRIIRSVPYLFYKTIDI